MSGWELSGGKCPGRQFFGWEVPVEELSGGELLVEVRCPGGQMSGGSFPGGNLPRTAPLACFPQNPSPLDMLK